MFANRVVMAAVLVAAAAAVPLAAWLCKGAAGRRPAGRPRRWIFPASRPQPAGAS